MADVASLSLEVRSDQVKQANLELRQMPQAASAAERAAQKWGLSADAAGKSSEEFSRRVRRNIEQLEFQRQQLGRSAAEQERYAALRRAGVTAESAAGQAVTASVVALQAQRAAMQASGRDMLANSRAATEGAGAMTLLTRSIAPLLAAFTAVAAVQKVWQAGMRTADLGEQAAQVNLLTHELQAYRFAAAQNGITNEQLDASLMRLHNTMGQAAKGGEEQIRIFQKLGVNMLDAEGKMRRPADLLPELARGLLDLGNETERNALMIEMFGRSGARMVTMLETWAMGTDNAVEAARRMGAITDPEAIARWDRLSDNLKKTGATVENLWSTIASPAAGAAATMLETIAKNLEKTTTAYNNLPKDAGFWDRVNALFGGSGIKPMGVDPADLADARLNAELMKLEKVRATANDNSEIDQRRLAVQQQKVAALQAEVELAQQIASINRQAGFEDDEAFARRHKLPVVGNAPGMNPVVKSQTDAWTKMGAQAQNFVAQKRVETEVLGLNAEAAARLIHEQQLMARATEAQIALGPAQIAQIKAWAAAMAEAEAQFKNAKFMDDANRNAEQFIATQQIERDTLYMSAEAAMAYRLEQEAINRAKAEGIALTPQQVDQLRQLAQAQAATAEETRKAKEWADFEKETFRGLFADINRGLREGANVWDVFANVGMNALNRISDKLMQMAADQLFEAAFGGSGGGGLFGGIGGWLGGLFGGGGGIGGAVGGIDPTMFVAAAKGAAFNRGNVIPFARGGVVDRPTLFPMARGAGLMGEAGPEGILPLRRGRNGRLGVEAGGSQQPVVVYVTGDTDLVRVTAEGAAVRVVKDATPGIVKESVTKSGERVVPIVNTSRAERGGDYRVA